MMKKEYKRRPSHPGGILKRHYLEPLDLSVSEVAKAIGVSRKTISMLVNERCAVTPDIALRLANAFGTTPELWLNLQQSHDLWQAAHSSTTWKKVHQLSFAC